MIISVLTV